MNPLVCVNCNNSKPVNLTSNRIVTESCGHLKCMDCLVLETSGCLACLRGKTPDELQADDFDAVDSVVPVQTELTEYEDGKDTQISYEDMTKKRKPETSHIKIETEANGRCYVCTVCKKRFHARSQVAYHAYCNGQRKPYQCPECNKSFATHSHFKYHMRVHRNERTYACDVCGDSFFQMSKLQRHKLKHTKEKKFPCPVCNKAFNNLSSLRKHALTHSEERPFACAACGRRFRDSSNYRKHVAKHEDKKCGCKTCGSGSEAGAGAGAGRGCLSTRSARTHQCPRCPQAFHSSKDMRRHAAVHSDSKPFRCKVCNRHFRRKDNLERHIRNTHPDYIASSAVECDETALKQITTVNGTPKPDTTDENEKTKLEKLNPLPPLSQEVIQKHTQEVSSVEIDKSYILVANNARESVIVGKCSIDKVPSPKQEYEYVHKMRKASHKDISLPPIDMQKVYELESHTTLNNLEIGMPTKDRKELYEKILYGDSDSRKSEDKAADISPDIHWRRKKMKLL